MWIKSGCAAGANTVTFKYNATNGNVPGTFFANTPAIDICEYPGATTVQDFDTFQFYGSGTPTLTITDGFGNTVTATPQDVSTADHGYCLVDLVFPDGTNFLICGGAGNAGGSPPLPTVTVSYGAFVLQETVSCGADVNYYWDHAQLSPGLAYTVPTGELVLTGFAPSLGGLEVPKGSLILTGFPPRVFTTGPVGAMCRRNITCRRITPHGWQGNNRIIYNRIEFELARGQGNNLVSDPVMNLSWSNDGGSAAPADGGPGNSGDPAFTNGVDLPTGARGQYKTRVYLNRCGYARDRVFQLLYTDQVYKGIVGAELDVLIMDS